jgi:anti-sigma B factor antagonist
VTVGETSLPGQRPQIVLPLSGELDVASATEAQKRMLDLELRPGAQLVFDLSGLTFMDSTGVRLILQANEHAHMHGAGFAIVRPPDRVLRVLALVGLDEQLDLVDRI